MSSFFDKLTDAVLNPTAVSKAQIPAVIGQAKAALKTDPEGAVKLLQFAVRNDASNVEAWSLLAGACSNANRSEEAEEAYRKWRDLRPEEAEPYLGIGTEMLTQEHPETAEAYLMHGLLLSKEPNAVDLYNLGLCFFQLGREAEAIPFCVRSFDLGPDPETAVLLGDCLYAGERYAEAADYYRRALASDPDNMHAAERLGFSEELQGHASEAIAALNKALAKGSAEPDIYASLSRCYEALDDRESSQKAAEKYYELCPTPTEEAEPSPSDG